MDIVRTHPAYARERETCLVTGFPCLLKSQTTKKIPKSDFSSVLMESCKEIKI